MKSAIKDILLISISIGLNIIAAYVGFIILTVFNQIIIGMNFTDSVLDKLLGKLSFMSFEGLIFIGFVYFLYLDIKTLLSSNVEQINELSSLEKYSTKGKLLLNQSYNKFKKVPFENTFRQFLKIYPIRILLVFILILPFYIYYIFLFLFNIVPFLLAPLTLIILLGSALLYQFDTKLGKKLEYCFIKYTSKITPDKIEDLIQKSNT